MFLALLLAAQPSAWIPARWPSGDPKTLEIVRQTPINCLLLEEPFWSAAFSGAADAKGIVTLGVVHPGAGDRVSRALRAGLTGIVFEGDFPDPLPDLLMKTQERRKIPYILLPSRARMRQGVAGTAAILGSDEGVWPGVRAQQNGQADAGPSASAWIDTNTGFLRYAAASHAGVIWLGNRPPPDTAFSPSRYAETIGDAAMTGARWVVSFDEDFSRRLLAGDAAALQGWKQIGRVLQFYESHARWRTWDPSGAIAVIEDAASGALVSGGIVDLIAAKHAPVRVIPRDKLTAASLDGVQLAIGLTGSPVLDAYARHGGKVLRSPPGWKYEPRLAGDFTASSRLAWSRFPALVIDTIGSGNFGVRLFNVSTVLSNLVRAPDGKHLVLHLVNYTDLPVESITIHLTGKFGRATLLQPGVDPQPLQPYAVDEGTGLDIEKLATVGAVEIE